jgi:hypothetical protein
MCANVTRAHHARDGAGGRRRCAARACALYEVEAAGAVGGAGRRICNAGGAVLVRHAAPRKRSFAACAGASAVRAGHADGRRAQRVRGRCSEARRRACCAQPVISQYTRRSVCVGRGCARHARETMCTQWTDHAGIIGGRGRRCVCPPLYECESTLCSSCTSCCRSASPCGTVFTPIHCVSPPPLSA